MAWFLRRRVSQNGASAYWLLACGVVVVLMLVTFVVLSWQARFGEKAWVRVGDGAPVAVEIADTPALRERGLSGRQGLASGHGMLFLFGRTDRYGFWMKDMLFPIDIIWIRDGAVVDFMTDVPPVPAGVVPPSYFAREPIDAVLEVPAGFCRERGLRIGLPVRVETTDVSSGF